MNGEMGREEALAKLAGLPYESEQLLRQDRGYFLKKMRWSEDKFRAYLDRPEVPHDAFPSERGLWDLALAAYRRFR